MKVLSFGSLNVDHVYAVENFVRPGETISSLGLERFCGGKGLNQSIALARAGAEVYHAGLVGEDGSMLTELMELKGVNIDYTKVIDGPSGHAIIQVSQKGQNCILLYGGSNMKIDEKFVDSVIENFNKGDLILLQNEISSLSYIMDKAYEKGLRIALNPSPFNDRLKECPLHKVEYFILNEIEGNEISGESEPMAIAKTIIAKYPGSKVVLTLGKDGVLYYDGEVCERHGIYDVKVVDTTAAGDTFTGYFLACIGEGLSPAIALEKASKASSLAVNKSGASVSIPSRDEVDATDIKLDKRFL